MTIGCGSGKLTRNQAKRLIEQDRTLVNSVVYGHDEYSCAVKAGLMTGSLFSYFATPRGTQLISRVKVISDGNPLILALSFIRSPSLEVQKVTGVTQTGTHGDAVISLVEFTAKYNFGDVPLDESSIPCFVPTQTFAMKANFQRYDDGWRFVALNP